MMEVKTIAIVGASDLGRRVAYLSALAGFRTILEDVSPLALEQGIDSITQHLDAEASTGKIAAAQRSAALANLTAANSAEDASREADLLIETVSDEIEMKIELFTIFDKFAKPGAILASTATKLPISELAAVTFCPEKCIGMRFHPGEGVQRLNRLKLVKTKDTSQDTIAECSNAARRMGLDVSVEDEEKTQV
jgi:3-hydroxybutyryl-CoA dehydrogenase